MKQSRSKLAALRLPLVTGVNDANGQAIFV
jgi:hypothetical protein